MEAEVIVEFPNEVNEETMSNVIDGLTLSFSAGDFLMHPFSESRSLLLVTDSFVTAYMLINWFRYRYPMAKVYYEGQRMNSEVLLGLFMFWANGQ